MDSELESTGNDSISSNNWILVGQFRNVETKMRQSLLLICSTFTKQIRIGLTVLCLWSLGLDPCPYAYQVGAAFAYVLISCVYICTYLHVHVGVDASVPV